MAYIRDYSEKTAVFIQTLMRRLRLSYQDVCLFLSSHYLATELGLPPKRLEDHPNIDYKDYMDQKTLNGIWRLIERAGKDGNSPTFLWEDVEDALNQDCRLFFLRTVNRAGETRTYKLRIALDDDKIHHAFTTAGIKKDKQHLCGAAAQRHAKANCNGFTLDSAVSATTGNPYCFRLRRQGSTERDNYEYMLKFMFHNNFMVASMKHVALSGIVFCSDRGYWKIPVMLLILGLAGTVFGTVMRQLWVPFTYDQPKERLGKRELINTRYGRSCFSAFGKFGNSRIKFSAWRDSKHSVSLGVNSDCTWMGDTEYDFNIRNIGDQSWYEDETLSENDRKLKAFQRISGGEVSEQDDKNIEHHLTMLPVTMLTCQDLTVEWFMMRMFSFTSSAAEAALKKSAPFLPAEFEERDSLKNVLEYIGHDNLLMDPSPDDMSVDSDCSASPGDDLPINAQLVSLMIKLMRRPTQKVVDNCATHASRIFDALGKRQGQGVLPVATMREMLIELGFSRQRALTKIEEKDMKKHLRTWIKSIVTLRSKLPLSCDNEDDDASSSSHLSHPSRSADNNEVIQYNFPYDILAAEEVLTLLRSRAGNTLRKGEVPGPHKNPTRKHHRIESLQWMDNSPSFELTARERGENHDPLRDSILAGAVSRAHLQPQQKDEKSAATLGHQNEIPYGDEYRRDSQNGKVPGIRIVDIRNPGMAMKEDAHYVRGTADFIAFQAKSETDEDDSFDSIESHLVECKCRSSGKYQGSLQQAKDIRRKIGRKIGNTLVNQTTDAVYMRVSSSDRKLLHDLIPDKSERTQLLHHAFTYGRNTTTLLVGDAQGRILYGLIVTFESQLLSDYGVALSYLYEKGLKLCYTERAEDIPVQLLEEILTSNQTLRKKYTIDDLMTSLLISRELRPGSDANIKYPIPACDKLLPLDSSLWNVSKGGSDITTRLAWNCQAVLPIKTPQTTIVGRYIALYSILFHRLVQAVTMRKPPDPATDTIDSIRNRNNKRYAMHESLKKLHRMLLKSAKDDGENSPTTAAAGVADSNFIRSAAPRFDPRTQSTRMERDHSVLGNVGTLGCTPIGNGKSKRIVANHDNYEALIKRYNTCTGNFSRVYTPDTKDGGGFKYKNGDCDLCGQKNTTTFCSGCKRFLCFDKDRSIAIRKRLQGEGEVRDRLLREYSVLQGLARGDVPPHYREIGKIDGKPLLQARSCFQFGHPNLCSACNTNEQEQEEEQEDDQMRMIVASSSSSSNASPSRAR